jgi:uncharacterized protein YqjF (DUF2071 family)
MQISRTAPVLTGRVVAAQEWRDVAFVHWRVPASTVAPLLPAGLSGIADGPPDSVLFSAGVSAEFGRGTWSDAARRAIRTP